MMAFKFIGTLICFISVSSFEIKEDFEVVDQQAILGILTDSFDFEVVYGLQDEYVLNNRFGLRRNLLADSDSNEVRNEDEFVLQSTGLRRKLLVDSDSNEVLNEDDFKEYEYVLESTSLRRRLSTDSDDYNYFLWLFCFFVFTFAYKCFWGYISLLYTSPSPRDQRGSRMPSSA